MECAGAVGYNALHHLTLHADLARFDIPQIGDNGHLFARLQLIDGAQLAVIFMAHWQMPQQIDDPLNPQARQIFRRGLTDPGQDGG